MSLVNKIKWIMIIGGSMFFFFRAVYLAINGGDCFGTINPMLSWILLISELVTSGSTWVLGILSYLKWQKMKESWLTQVILFTGIMAYVFHFIRVAIWIYFCVIFYLYNKSSFQVSK